MPREKTCPICKGWGKTAPAKDLLARSPLDQAEYDREHAALGEFTCSLCGGSGKVGEPAELERAAGREEVLELVQQMAAEFRNQGADPIARGLEKLMKIARERYDG